MVAANPVAEGFEGMPVLRVDPLYYYSSISIIDLSTFIYCSFIVICSSPHLELTNSKPTGALQRGTSSDLADTIDLL